MKTLLALSLAGACTAVGAQTPANNPMPDGSRDLYVGLGAVSAPAYAGGSERRTRALPLVQFAWSNGVFISGASAGMHLSQQPAIEYGPLLAFHPKRGHDGLAGNAGGIEQSSVPGMTRPSGGRGPMIETFAVEGLTGMDEVKARVQAGVFANFYVTPSLRLANSVLYGAGKWRDGMVWNVALQHTAADMTARHRLTYSAGLTMVNERYNASYFGVSESESFASGYPGHAPRPGISDVYLGAGWNWALSPSWMVVSRARATRLKGDARNSPLVQRSTNYAISTGLAYRF